MRIQMKKSGLMFCLALAGFYAAAQPAGYYSNATGLDGSQLRSVLHEIIKNHNAQEWPLWNYFPDTDKKPDGKVWDIYSDRPGQSPAYEFEFVVNQCGNYSAEADCYNHEHSWPSTYFNDNTPMRTDLNHIFPTDGYVNNKRSNLPFGYVINASWTSQNGSQVGNSNDYAEYTDKVFEPIDSFKGDMARTYFYMSTRYQGEDGNWKNWIMANGAELTPDAVALLLEWHHEDPVSQKEIDRNNAVYNIQNNRNPFIDYPPFADCIWGGPACILLATHERDLLSDRLLLYPNPVTSGALYFSLDAPVGITRVEVSDMTGRILDLPAPAGPSLDISNLPAGMYILRVATEQGMALRTFIRQ